MVLITEVLWTLRRSRCGCGCVVRLPRRVSTIAQIVLSGGLVFLRRLQNFKNKKFRKESIQDNWGWGWGVCSKHTRTRFSLAWWSLQTTWFKTSTDVKHEVKVVKFCFRGHCPCFRFLVDFLDNMLAEDWKIELSWKAVFGAFDEYIQIICIAI